MPFIREIRKSALNSYEIITSVPGVQKKNVSNVTQWTNLDMLKDAWPNYDDVSFLFVCSFPNIPFFQPQATARNISDIMIAGFSNGVIPAADDHLGWTKLVTDVRFLLVYFICSRFPHDQHFHQSSHFRCPRNL